MKELKEVEFDESACKSDCNAICPYCKSETYVEGDCFDRQDEENIEECGNCGKKFVNTINYSVTFSSEPYENWLISQIKLIKGKIEYYKQAVSKKIMIMPIDYYQAWLENAENSLTELLKEAEKLEVEE